MWQFIPRNFLERHGESLANQIGVKLPCGSEWKFGLKKHKEIMWLEDTAWSKFVEFYSLKIGSVIAFRYKGNSEFEAFIFDKTVEIDYPIAPIPSQSCERKRKIPEDDDDSVGIFESFCAKKKGNEAYSKKRTKSSVETKTKGTVKFLLCFFRLSSKYSR